MSYSNYYLPEPPRAWSRVDNKCTYDNTNNNDKSYDPFLYHRAALLNKGNVLQYKKNSSQLTKNQRYSQIAKGLWTNRTKTWATQSYTYTNPNTISLKRVGFVEYPKNDIIPGSPANLAGPYVPVSTLTDPFNCPNFTFKDGGSLVCSTYENPCTGEVVERTFQPNYYPTSDSDVPGPIKYLYWDPRLQTWFPRERLTMSNSLNKWPINYKLFKSAIHPGAPKLEIVSSTINSVELAWTIDGNDNRCFPVSKFSIFVDNSLYKTIVNSTDYTTTLSGLNNGPYDIYIIGILSGNSSPPSNIVVYNNEIVVKSSVDADNKTYSDNVTDLSNQITDIASGNATVVNTTSGNNIFNSKNDYYIIENTNNTSNAISLPDYLITENNKTITIVNKTPDILTILSTAPMYNILYAPDGNNILEVPTNGTANLRYIYDQRNQLTIHATIT